MKIKITSGSKNLSIGNAVHFKNGSVCVDSDSNDFQNVMLICINAKLRGAIKDLKFNGHEWPFKSSFTSELLGEGDPTMDNAGLMSAIDSFKKQKKVDEVVSVPEVREAVVAPKRKIGTKPKKSNISLVE